VFEGSYLGDNTVLDAGSRLECKICWWVYDPARGDPIWGVAPGTPFAELPPHWKCPNCDGAREQFMLLSD
jgi:rubredoxin